MRNTYTTVHFGPHKGNSRGGGHMKFASYDAWESHLNICFSNPKYDNGDERDFCLSPEEALRIRDTLNEIYPLELFPKDRTVELKFKVLKKNASQLIDAAIALKAEKIDG